MNKFLRIISIATQEMNQCIHDQGVLIFIILLPLAYPLLYGAIYHNQNAFDVPVAVIDDSHSPEAREFIRRLDATQGIQVASHCTDMAQAEEEMRQTNVYAVARIPKSFSADLTAGRQTRIGMYVNMATSLYYKQVLLAANNVVMDMNKDISVSRMPTTTSRERQIARQPVRFEYVPLFNTVSGFASFLIPPVLMLILQQTLLLGIGMSMGRMREDYRRNMHKLRTLYMHPFEIIIGRSIPYLALYVIMATYMFTFVTRIFALPSVGDYIVYLSMFVPYLLACTLMGIILSCLVYRREDCIMLFVSLSVPMLFVSGVVWPAEQMPAFWRWAGSILPSTWGMHAYVKLHSMGASYQQILPEIKILWLQAAIYFAIALCIYKWRMGKLKRVLGE